MGHKSDFMDCQCNGVSDWHLDQPEENWNDFSIKNVRKRNYEYKLLLVLTVNLWQKISPDFLRIWWNGMRISEKLLTTIQFIIFQIIINAVLHCLHYCAVHRPQSGLKFYMYLYWKSHLSVEELKYNAKKDKWHQQDFQFTEFLLSWFNRIFL